MDEDDLATVLRERAERGEARGADQILDRVRTALTGEMTLPSRVGRPTRGSAPRGRAFVAIAFVLVTGFVVSVAQTWRRDEGALKVTLGGASTVDSRRPSTTTPPPPKVGEQTIDIDAVDRDTAWLTTSQRLLVTHNGGSSWEVLTTFPLTDSRNAQPVFALSNSSGGVLALPGTASTRILTVHGNDVQEQKPIVSSMDGALEIVYEGGRYWLIRQAPCDLCAADVWTSDDGTQWTRQRNESGLSGVRCARHDTCWAVTYRRDATEAKVPVIERTLDGGHRWTPIVVPFPSFNIGLGGGATILAARDQLFVVRVDVPSGMEERPVFLASTDGGKTFKSHEWTQSIMGTGPQLTTTIFDPTHWIATWSNQVLTSNDLGATWQRVGTIAPYVRVATSWPDRTTGWIAGDIDAPGADIRRSILTSTESGSEWRDITPVAPHRATALPQDGIRNCNVSDYSLDYYGGGAGMGNEFGAITIRDTSSTKCRFVGPVIVTGITGAGRKVTDTRTYEVHGDLVLTASAHRVAPGQGARLGEVIGNLVMESHYRDDMDSPNGLCTAAHTIVPAAWLLEFPDGSRHVANDSIAPPGAGSRWTRLLTCHGEINTPEPIGRVEVSH